ncbi:oxidoreductase [Romboutsia sp.]|uniref:oxidoreductase n=1 Tax=Romboutsia sp. TaxID=1965302 RepID=UPI003F2A9012
MSDIYENKIEEIVKDIQTWFDDEKRMEEGKFTNNLYPYKSLFEPIYINDLKLKNRIVMGPMGNISFCDNSGKPNNKLIEYYLERAKGGTGLIISGMVPTNYKDDPSYGDKNATGIFPRIDTHRNGLSGWKDIVEGCHAYGSRFFVQLAPGMGRVGNPECLLKKFKLPISSSLNSNWYIPQIPCRPITNFEIKKIIKHTGEIAADFKYLGVDGVHLHGHSGYLIEQMTDPAFNRRKLGRYSNWQNFGLDLVREVRKKCGDRYPIYYRIDLSLALKETYKDRLISEKELKKFNKGRTLTMSLEYMKNLVEAGVDAFDVDMGGYENWWLPHPPNGMPPGVYLGLSSLVKEYFLKNKILSNRGKEVPIIAVGKLGYPDLAESALRENKADMILLSRPLLADPNWPNKVYGGKVDEIIPCIGDHEGCLAQLSTGGHPQCAVNPRTAFEDVYQKEIIKSEIKKKIAVVGAGPSGAVFASTASRRGHEVVLYDRNSKAGGMLLLGSVPKIKFDVKNYIDYLNLNLSKAKEDFGLKVHFNTNITIEELKKEDYDTIVFATGTNVFIPKIPGIDNEKIVKGLDFLRNPILKDEEKDIVVIGGSDVGCEVAYMISREFKDKKVTIVEMQPHFMSKSCTSNRGFMIHHLNEMNVKLMNCTVVKEINDNKIIVSKNIDKGVPDPTVTWRPILPENVVNPFSKTLGNKEKIIELEYDKIVLCTGTYSNDKLFEECKREGLGREIYNIGDSFSPGRVLEAVKSGYRLGYNI